MIEKNFIAIAIVAVLLTAWSYRVSINDSFVHSVIVFKKVLLFADYNIAGEIKYAWVEKNSQWNHW